VPRAWLVNLNSGLRPKLSGLVSVFGLREFRERLIQKVKWPTESCGPLVLSVFLFVYLVYLLICILHYCILFCVLARHRHCHWLQRQLLLLTWWVWCDFFVCWENVVLSVVWLGQLTVFVDSLSGLCFIYFYLFCAARCYAVLRCLCVCGCVYHVSEFCRNE